MGRTKDGKSKGKGVLIEGGTSKRRQTTPSLPESGALVPISPNPENAYPFNARMRMTTIMKEREAKLRNFKVLNPIYPDLGLLASLDILEEVSCYFNECGFGFVFDADPPLVYETLVREFVYSFEPEWIVIPRHQSKFSIVEKDVKAWKFRLGGVDYRYSRRELLRLLQLPDRELYPYVRLTVLDTFWRMISGCDEDFVPSQQSTRIVLPVWRLVHRFIACCVALRKDEGRWVTRYDLELMCCFYRHKKIDPLIPITKSLEESTISNFRGTYIAGGPFVTLIALGVGFSLDPQFALPRVLLGEREMIRRGFLKLVRSRHGIYRQLVGRDVPPQDRPAPPPPPPSSQGEAGTSSAPQQSVTMEDLSAQLHALTAYTHEGFLWAGDVFTDLYSKMGYDDFPPPPPHPSDILHSDAPDYTEEEGYVEDTEEDSEDDHDDDGGDDEEDLGADSDDPSGNGDEMEEDDECSTSF